VTEGRDDRPAADVIGEMMEAYWREQADTLDPEARGKGSCLDR